MANKTSDTVLILGASEFNGFPQLISNDVARAMSDAYKSLHDYVCNRDAFNATSNVTLIDLFNSDLSPEEQCEEITQRLSDGLNHLSKNNYTRHNLHVFMIGHGVPDGELTRFVVKQSVAGENRSYLYPHDLYSRLYREQKLSSIYIFGDFCYSENFRPSSKERPSAQSSSLNTFLLSAASRWKPSRLFEGMTMTGILLTFLTNAQPNKKSKLSIQSLFFRLKDYVDSGAIPCDLGKIDGSDDARNTKVFPIIASGNSKPEILQSTKEEIAKTKQEINNSIADIGRNLGRTQLSEISRSEETLLQYICILVGGHLKEASEHLRINANVMEPVERKNWKSHEKLLFKDPLRRLNTYGLALRITRWAKRDELIPDGILIPVEATIEDSIFGAPKAFREQTFSNITNVKDIDGLCYGLQYRVILQIRKYFNDEITTFQSFVSVPLKDRDNNLVGILNIQANCQRLLGNRPDLRLREVKSAVDTLADCISFRNEEERKQRRKRKRS